MTRISTLTIIAIFLQGFLSQVVGQSTRKIPYPILFVHGWTGSDETWFKELAHLKAQGLNVDIDYVGQRAGWGSKLEYMLNYQQSTHLKRNGTHPNYGDVVDMASYANPENDVFVINFDVGHPSYQSNQSAIAKQGFAVGLAVRKILQTTGADKIVLFGHSMGGLAIREYLQNKENWLTGDNSHHVAKLITSGTPHQGSSVSLYGLLQLVGKDETSEAVRDMRTNNAANYLNGGHEANVPKTFQNNDIDCDSYMGYVTGLNQKPIYLNLHYACIVGLGGKSIGGYLGYDDDDVVSATSANLFNLSYQQPLTGDLFYIHNAEQQSGNDWDWTWHTKLPMQTFFNQYALDEPSELHLSYQIKPNRTYTGFFTPTPGGFDIDHDRYRIDLSQRGVLAFESTIESNASAKLFDLSRNEMSDLKNVPFVIIPEGGEYSIGLSGTTGASSGQPLHFVRYNFTTNFCPLPERPSIQSNGPTTVCEGETVGLFVKNAGYDSYSWFHNSVKVGTGLAFTASKSGTYYVEGAKCGVSERSVNELTVIVNPIPPKPVISISGDSLVSSALTGNQWYSNGVALQGSTGQRIKNAGAAGYSVKVNDKGCSAESDVFAITGIETQLEKATVVYPNPSPGNIEISTPLSGKVIFSLIDSNGKLLSSEKQTLSAGKTALSLKARPGLYFLKIEAGDTQFYKKIIIE